MTKTKAVTLASLVDSVRSYFPEAKVELIEKAYEFSNRAHQGQLRASGDPYIIHPLEVAQVLAEL